MKIIFSRKGFDSSAGGVASPILPGGALCSLPIPAGPGGKEVRRYSEIKLGALSLGTLVHDLTNGKITGDHRVHLDPDLRCGSVPRAPGWQPVFGQDGAAESHLHGHGVGPGDLFLFFGWFRQVTQVAGHYRYVKDAPDLHMMFGWLQVDRRIPVSDRAAIPSWALDHPHSLVPPYAPVDSIYLATDRLQLPGVSVARPGAGVFECVRPDLCLTTAGGRRRSRWRLPAWFDPAGRAPLSYHDKRWRWTRDGDYVFLQTVGRGQEFVLDGEQYPEAIGWLARLFNAAPT